LRRNLVRMKPFLMRIYWRRNGYFLCSSLNSGMRMTSCGKKPFLGKSFVEKTYMMMNSLSMKIYLKT
jgi:hypothetical protein